MPLSHILIITLTNIGDVILTLPVVDILHHSHPSAKITLVGGPNAAGLFRDNPWVNFVSYNKRASWREKLRFLQELRRRSYDLVVDLRNTAIPFLVSAKVRTPIQWKRFTGVHIKDTHLLRFQTVWHEAFPDHPAKVLTVPADDQVYVETLLPGEPYIAFSPGAADIYKRWPAERFAELADRLIAEKNVRVVLTASANEASVAAEVMKPMRYSQKAVDLSGRTNLIQAAQVFLKAKAVIANDSGPMHLASYLDVPTIGIFGYSDPAYARPWGRGGAAIRKNESCQACRLDAERLSGAKNQRHIAKDGRDHTCLQGVTADDVFQAVVPLLR